MSQQKIRARFLKDYEVQDEHAGTERATKYIAGKFYALSPDSMRHFQVRGLAEPAAKAAPGRQ